MTSALAAELHVVVNGDTHCVPAETTVAGLLMQMDTSGKRVAVERNGAIVPRSAHAQTQLADGDVLEVVVAVGGG